MLSYIGIRNFAIIDSLDLDFKQGMTTLTGETGAGKSIIIDALGLVLGNRAQTHNVRSHTEKSEVTVEFTVTNNSSAAKWLSNNDFNAEHICLLRRIITADGKSRGYINGIPVPLSQMKALGEHLVDIHGQHDNYQLLQAEAQRRLLDEFAQNKVVRTEVKKAFAEYSHAQTLLDEALTAKQGQEEKLALLEFQVNELDILHPQTEEWLTLSQQQQTLSQANEALTQTNAAIQILYESDVGNVTIGLHDALTRLQTLKVDDKALHTIIETLEQSKVQIEEISRDLIRYRDNVELNPEKLHQVETRMGIWLDLARKHHLEPESLPAHHENLQQALAQLKNPAQAISALQTARDEALTKLQDTSAALSKTRNNAAQNLSTQVTASIAGLGMPEGDFQIALIPSETLTAHGQETIQYQVSLNKGQPFMPIQKVASGGELARIGLAIRVATAKQGDVETLIFDEVDTGIGGSVAEIVGQHLRSLGEHRQVMCVTHLPQVAAQGHHQFKVEKSHHSATTTTTLTSLNTHQRINEIARMLGGVNITQNTLAHAQEMLMQHEQHE